MKNTISKLMILSLALMPLVGCERKEADKPQNSLNDITMQGAQNIIEKYMKASLNEPAPEKQKSNEKDEKEICLLSEEEKYQVPVSKPLEKKAETKKEPKANEVKAQTIKPSTKAEAKKPAPAVQEREIQLQFSEEGCGC
jgi:outer membrane biosynthesis protein TonB